jgi:hypothetical protein
MGFALAHPACSSRLLIRGCSEVFSFTRLCARSRKRLPVLLFTGSTPVMYRGDTRILRTFFNAVNSGYLSREYVKAKNCCKVQINH